MNSIILLATSCLSFIAVKFWYASASTEDLAFVLSPTTRLVEWITGYGSVYLLNQGHYFNSLDILISKSCSGFNFFLTCIIMLVVLLSQREWTLRGLLLRIPQVIFIAYGLTIIANCYRISTAILLKPMVPAELIAPATLHKSIGIVIYLSFLLITYLLTEKQLLRNNCS